MSVAIVYTSITGNTKDLSTLIFHIFKEFSVNVSMYSIHEFPTVRLNQIDGIVIGTYTWGDGDIPKELEQLYKAIESSDTKRLITGVFGSGDRFYPNYCGAVDQFRDMLFVHTDLAVTLKVELTPQEKDRIRCRKFVELFLQRIHEKQG